MIQLIEAKSPDGESAKLIRLKDLSGYVHRSTPREKPLQKVYTGLFLTGEGIHNVQNFIYQTFPHFPDNFRLWPMDHITLVDHPSLSGEQFLKVQDAMMKITEEKMLNDYELRFSQLSIVKNKKSGGQDYLFLEVQNTKPLMEVQLRLTDLLKGQGLVAEAGQDFRDRWHLTVGSSAESVPLMVGQQSDLQNMIDSAGVLEEVVPFYLGIKAKRRIRRNGQLATIEPEIFSPVFAKE